MESNGFKVQFPFETLFDQKFCESFYSTEMSRLFAFALVVAVVIFVFTRVLQYVRIALGARGLKARFKASVLSPAALKCAAWIVLAISLIYPINVSLMVCSNLKVQSTSAKELLGLTAVNSRIRNLQPPLKIAPAIDNRNQFDDAFRLAILVEQKVVAFDK